MNLASIDLILQYAVAVAAERDSLHGGSYLREQELGPIHFVKYAYLADLAHASAHEGRTFTGARWRFHHYGPWDREVWQRIKPAMSAVGANERHFASRYQDDAVRWSLKEPGLADELERKLPHEVASAVRRSVLEHGNDTASLLHAVYSTPPMLQAAPGEDLAMQAAVEPAGAPPAAPPGLKPLSKTRLTKLRARLRQRIEELKKKEAANPPLVPRPNYDEVFFAGRDWLDSLAGDPIEESEGELLFDDSVWTSAARREPKLP